MIRFAMLAVVTVSISAGASADPSGNWSFKTDIEAKGCSISGTMTVEPAKNNRHSCSFTSREVCNDPGDLQGIVIDQTCTLIRQPDNGLIILSEVAQSITTGYDVNNYLPDNFSLDDIAPNQMTGDWWDEQFTAPVVFWRDKNLPVS